MKAHDIFATADPKLFTDMLDWFRANDRKAYRSAVQSLAAHRKLRPVFIEKKPLPDQYEWIIRTLKLASCESIAEQLLQAYLMAGQQPLLAAFCDAMGIEHDGKGLVNGDLPEELDAARLATAVDSITGQFDPKLVALYLHCFNRQVDGGWPTLTEKLASDERLALA